MTNKERFGDCEFDEGRFNAELQKLGRNVAERERKKAKQSLRRFDMTNRVRHLVAFDKAAEEQQRIVGDIAKLQEVA